MVQIPCRQQSTDLHLILMSWLPLTGAALLGSALLGSMPLGLSADETRPPAGVVEGESASHRGELEQRIDRLIEQLGSSEYATREKSQSELEQLGLDAFDALNHAQYNDDIEIALRARYLVRSMQVNWSRDTDSSAVKQLLKDYGGKSEGERRNLMQQLAALDDQDGIEALCRLVRYEASFKLSKRAALLVMGLEHPAEAEAELDGQQETAELIRSAVGLSRRPASGWLLSYAQLLAGDAAALDRCQQIIAEEQRTLAHFSDQTSSELMRDLLRWYADQLQQRSLTDEAVAAMRQTIDLLDGSRQQVLDTVDWLRNREGWGIVLEVSQRFPDTFSQDPLLLYRVAQAETELGRSEQAKKSAERALKAALDKPDRHLEVAAHLQHDGLFEWAELEYRHVIDEYPSDPTDAVRARMLLSEMLHDIGSDFAASELLGELLASIESDESVREFVVSKLGREETGIRARMLFFRSLHHAERNETDEQRVCLLQGYEKFPLDADILIAMYRLSDADEAWRKQAVERIGKATTVFRKQVAEYKAQATKSLVFEERAQAVYQLASAYNQLAWLVANTEGDFDEALQSSRRSLELRPTAAGFFDTLGRCYYAKGSFANAVTYQTRAAAMEPHSPQILQQLELFRKAKAESLRDESD